MPLVKGPARRTHELHKHRTLWLHPTDRGIIYWSYANFTAGPRGKRHQKDPTRARFCARARTRAREAARSGTPAVRSGKTTREYERTAAGLQYERKRKSERERGWEGGGRREESMVFREYYAPELEFPNNETPREPHERPPTTFEEKRAERGNGGVLDARYVDYFKGNPDENFCFF